MGKFTFRLPDIGEGIAEAEIVSWHVKVGDRIEEDGKIADVMTDKATVEMESPVSGVVLEVAGAEGDMIAIGSPLVVIETDEEGEVEEPAPAPKAEPAPAPQPAPEPVAAVAPVAPPPAPAPEQPLVHAAKVLASPAVRARAADLGIDLAQVKPAEDGRVRHADLDAFLAYNAAGGFRAPGGKRADQQVKV
ncbi:MAG: hypothetical protein RL339_2676, partial [Pseudomonadota bacterium]